MFQKLVVLLKQVYLKWIFKKKMVFLRIPNIVRWYQGVSLELYRTLRNSSNCGE